MLDKNFNLFSQAEFYLQLSDTIKSEIGKDNTRDDYLIRECCLKLQMSIELMLKGLVENLCGCDYKCTHELRDNIKLLDDNKDNILEYSKLDNILQRVEEKADRIKEFHTNAVYVNGFASNLREIALITKIAYNLLDYINLNVIPKKVDLNSINKLKAIAKK